MPRAWLLCENPDCGVEFEGERNEDGMILSPLCDECQIKADAESAARPPVSAILDVVAGWQAVLERILPFQPKNEDHIDELVDLHVALKGVDGDRSDNGLIGHLQDFAHELDAAIAEQMTGAHDLVAGYALERKGGTIRKQWQSDVLVKEVATRSIDRVRTNEDGEVRDLTPAEAAEAVLTGLIGAAPITTPSLGWRVGGLRDLGIDPDMYCQSERGPAHVIVRRNAIEADPQQAGSET